MDGFTLSRPKSWRLRLHAVCNVWVEPNAAKSGGVALAACLPVIHSDGSTLAGKLPVAPCAGTEWIFEAWRRCPKVFAGWFQRTVECGCPAKRSSALRERNRTRDTRADGAPKAYRAPLENSTGAVFLLLLWTPSPCLNKILREADGLMRGRVGARFSRMSPIIAGALAA